MADGTAQQCGRVGSCHILLKTFTFTCKGFFYAPYSHTPFPNREVKPPAEGAGQAVPIAIGTDGTAQSRAIGTGVPGKPG